MYAGIEKDLHRNKTKVLIRFSLASEVMDSFPLYDGHIFVCNIKLKLFLVLKNAPVAL